MAGQFLYRFDLYLSLKDRNGNRVEPGKLLNIKDQIVKKFGGLTMTSIFGNPMYDGFWRSPESMRVFRDKTSIFTVLVPQDRASIEFFLGKKPAWEKDLNYEQLLITAHELQAI